MVIFVEVNNCFFQYDVHTIIALASTYAKCIHFFATDQHLDNDGVCVFYVNFLDDNADGGLISGSAVANVVRIPILTVSNIPADVHMARRYASAVALH